MGDVGHLVKPFSEVFLVPQISHILLKEARYEVKVSKLRLILPEAQILPLVNDHGSDSFHQYPVVSPSSKDEISLLRANHRALFSALNFICRSIFHLQISGHINWLEKVFCRLLVIL